MRAMQNNWLVLGSVALVLVFVCPAHAQEKAAKLDKEGILLQSLGSLSGVYLYQTHMKLGLIHDAKAKAVYDDKIANQHLGTLINLINLVDGQLGALDNAGLSKEDRFAFAKIRGANSLLKKQAAALKSSWGSKAKKEQEAFTKIRGESFKVIAELLGIKK